MTEYIIFDFTNTQRDTLNKVIGEPTIKRVTESSIWDELDRIKNDEREVSIYELGKCLLDWS